MTEQPEQPTEIQDENEAGMPYAAASDYRQAPAQTEQQFLGNEHYGEAFVSIDPKFQLPFKPEHWPEDLFRQRPPKERLGIWFPAPEGFKVSKASEPRTDLLVEAETAAHHASKSFENGEIAAGIAWSESAVAFGKQALPAHKESPARIFANAPVASPAVDREAGL